MKNFEELSDNQLANVTGGKGVASGLFGIVYTIVGEWPDMKAGFIAGVKAGKRDFH